MRISYLIAALLFLPCVNPGFWSWFVPAFKVFTAVVAAGAAIVGTVLTAPTGVGAVAGVASCIGALNNVGNAVSGMISSYQAIYEEQQRRARVQRERQENEKHNQKQTAMIHEINNMTDQIYNKATAFMNEFDKTLDNQKQRIDAMVSDLNELNEAVSRNFNALKMAVTDLQNEIEAKLEVFYKHVSDALEYLEYNFGNQFRALNHLRVELEFTEEIMVETDVLENLMIQTMQYPTQETNEEFIEQYRTKGPREIIMEISNRLKYKYTNSISAAMELHVFDSRTIYDLWITNIGHIVYKLLTIEGFYFGLVEFPKNASLNATIYHEPLYDAVETLMRDLGNFKTAYTIDSHAYWPNLVGYNVDEILRFANNKIKPVDMMNYVADAVHSMLNKIHTTDVFTIYVAEADETNKKTYEDVKSDNKTYLKEIKTNNFYIANRFGNKNDHTNVITTYNSESKLLVSVVRSAEHHKLMESDMELLNYEVVQEIERGKIKMESSTTIDDFFNDINDEIGGLIGGGFISSKPFIQRITNGERSPLYWYNQVASPGLFFNIMWI